jgi:hypothetical protein
MYFGIKQKLIYMIDFKNLTKEQDLELKSLILAMQNISLGDLHNLGDNGTQILTFESDQRGTKEKPFPLDFKNLNEETAKSLSSLIENLQQSLINNLNEEKYDAGEKGILLSTSQGPVNFNRKELIDAVSNLTIIGIYFLKLHWDNINAPFKSKTFNKKKNYLCRLKFWKI